MDAEFITLSVAVLAASALQSATGIGFGVIAGPVLLVVMNDSAGIQVSVMLNLLIALLLARSLMPHADREVLTSLAGGIVLGSPLGLMIYMNLDLLLLKVLAAIAVLFSLILLLRTEQDARRTVVRQSGGAERVLIGAVGGVMGGSLAMPGPVPAAWMAARGYEKQTVRATILLMFVVAYTLALLLQFIMAGISSGTLTQGATLAPATIAGVVLGHALSKRIGERTFRRILIVILSLTIALLILTMSA